jgi:hypothetical protein
MPNIRDILRLHTMEHMSRNAISKSVHCRHSLAVPLITGSHLKLLVPLSCTTYLFFPELQYVQ